MMDGMYGWNGINEKNKTNIKSDMIDEEIKRQNDQRRIALPIEQMEELKSLGLDCSDASMTWVEHNKVDKPPLLMCLENRDAGLFQQLKRIPAYTLEDILCKTEAEISYNSRAAKTSRQKAGGYQAPRPWQCTVTNSNDMILCFAETPLNAAFKALKEMLTKMPDNIKKLS